MCYNVNIGQALSCTFFLRNSEKNDWWMSGLIGQSVYIDLIVGFLPNNLIIRY